MISTTEIIRINQERFTKWQAVLIDKHSTPAILIGIGHDHRAGEIDVCFPENLPTQLAIAYLARTMMELSKVVETEVV